MIDRLTDRKQDTCTNCLLDVPQQIATKESHQYAKLNPGKQAASIRHGAAEQQSLDWRSKSTTYRFPTLLWLGIAAGERQLLRLRCWRLLQRTTKVNSQHIVSSYDWKALWQGVAPTKVPLIPSCTAFEEINRQCLVSYSDWQLLRLVGTYYASTPGVE